MCVYVCMCQMTGHLVHILDTTGEIKLQPKAIEQDLVLVIRYMYIL